jgi:hypothetical protein
LALLFFPHTVMTLANNMIGATVALQTAYVVMALFGLYLTYVGWIAAPDRPQPHTKLPTKDLPRAA